MRTYQNWAEAIVAERKRAGITQAELAKRMAVTPQSVSQYERGIKSPGEKTANKFAEAIGVRMWKNKTVHAQNNGEEEQSADLVIEMNREFVEHISNVGTPGHEYDDSYNRVRLPREFFIRMCRALKETANIAHKLHTLAYEKPEKEPGTHWGKMEVVYKFFADFMQWDEKKHIRVVIDYDPDAEKVLLLRCPVTHDGKQPLHPAGE